MGGGERSITENRIEAKKKMTEIEGGMRQHLWYEVKRVKGRSGKGRRPGKKGKETRERESRHVDRK